MNTGNLENNRGFSLIEIVIALAILAFSVTALVSFHARGYVNDGKARRLSNAVLLARVKMAELKLNVEKEVAKGSFPEESSENGEFDKPFEDYKWSSEVRRVELPMPPAQEGEEGSAQAGIMAQMMQGVIKQISEAVRELKLTIKWEEMGREREFSVVTHIVKL